MVIKQELTDLRGLIDPLLTDVQTKIRTGIISTVNSDMNGDLKIDLATLKSLLRAIDCKIRKCEMIYYSYLYKVDHGALCGSPFSEDHAVSIELIYNTSVIKSTIILSDRDVYTELIDMNFQTFILTLASLFENLVRLKEILVKRVIIRRLQGKHEPTPLDIYFEYLKNLVKLGYRQEDSYFLCIQPHLPFFDKYLKTILVLRNRYIHGFQSLLGPNSENYVIIETYKESPFNPNSPELAVDAFSEMALVKSTRFIKDLLGFLKKAIGEDGVALPL